MRVGEQGLPAAPVNMNHTGAVEMRVLTPRA